VGKSIILLLKRQNPRLSLFIDMLDPAKIGAILLKGWNIPAKVCEAVEYQCYPEFFPPDRVPTEEVDSIAVVFLAHAATDFILGSSDSTLKTPYLSDYMHLLGFRDMSLADLVDNYLLVDLNMNIETFPKHVRAFILTKTNSQKSLPSPGGTTSGKSMSSRRGTLIDTPDW
jgi:hypothetical protein